MKILVIDDEKTVLQGLDKLVRTARPDDAVVCYDDPFAALRYAKQNNVDIVISDVQMPRMNGLELCRELKSVTDAKIIIISGYDDFDYAVSALQLGAVHYILKPIRQQLLLDTLEKTIQQQRMERSERAAALDARRIQLQSLLCKLANGISAAIPEGILRDYRIGLLCLSTPAGDFAPESIIGSAVPGCTLTGYSEYQKNQFVFALSGPQASSPELYGMIQDALNRCAGRVSFAISAFYADESQLPAAVLQAGLQLERVYWKREQAGEAPELVVRVNEILAADCAGATLQRVAEQLGFNAAYFSALFKEKAGVNFKDYLFDYKILRARQLLRGTDMLIGNISVSLGYQNADHFSKAFRERVGVSPSVFRTQCEEERNCSI